MSDQGNAIAAPMNSATPLPIDAARRPGMKRMFSIGWMTNTDVPLEVQDPQFGKRRKPLRLTGKVKFRFLLNFDFQRLTHGSSVRRKKPWENFRMSPWR
ncbi:MAG TPA: hypothetical protein VHT68_18710 [Pseudolabrys sp.]|nr:hypothetical protein [Pseudolabrys sp.]